MNDEYKKALAVALKLVNYCDRTKTELQKKLEEKGVSDDIIKSVIAQLESEGFINDRRYAEYYITCYSGKRSRRRIAKELSDRGISDIIIEEYIDECDDDEALRKALDKQLRKRGLSDSNNISIKDREKIAAALYRQGFEPADIRFYTDAACNN